MITNIFGSYNLLNLAKQNPKCKFILLSSVEIYGDDNIGLEKGFAENDFGYLDCNNVVQIIAKEKELPKVYVKHINHNTV